MASTGKYFAPSLCVTHDCNLSCIYCYQRHSIGAEMPFETATKAIDWIFSHVPDQVDEVVIDFIGGEPLLKFLIKAENRFRNTCEKAGILGI